MRVEGLASLNNELRSLDRKALNKLRGEMRKSIGPVAREIANDVPL
jgi:hypothetical protein